MFPRGKTVYICFVEAVTGRDKSFALAARLPRDMFDIAHS